MNPVFSPALRPSHPHGCRKRAFRQGHALSGRFAGLDQTPLLSGYGYLRATDEEASGGGSVKGSPQARSTKTATQQSASHFSRLSPIPTRGGHDTCKPVPAYSPQNLLDTYGVASRPAFKCPHRHAHHADLALCRMLTARFPHGVQALGTYHFPASRMLARCCRHAYQQHTGYNSTSRLIRTRHIPDARIMRLWFCTDACSFVRHYLRWPAYVSSIRCAYSLTAGEGQSPFEPQKAKRRERQ